MEVTTRIPRAPRSSDRILTGVAAGRARTWHVDPTVVRAAIGVLGLVGGLGVVLYALLFVLSADGSGDRSDDRRGGVDGARADHDPRRALAIASGTAAVLVLARSIGLWAGDRIMAGAVVVAVGVVLTWIRSEGDGRARAGSVGRAALVRRIGQTLIGLALLAAGVISLASRTGGLSNLGASASAIAVVVGGLAVFAAPALGRVLQALDAERSNRIRDDEMARVSAHLHDSVLQSLALIQRSDDPRKMSNLARRQERELRAWLYGDVTPGGPATLAPAVEALAATIESDHDVRVEAVVVGDQPLDDAATALLSAIREAVVNAARHADVGRIDVFVEADDAELTGFVRDTGVGFDPTAVPDGHRGIEDSIIGRVRRAGGTSVVDSRLGAGTEVEIRIPRVARRAGS